MFYVCQCENGRLKLLSPYIGQRYKDTDASDKIPLFFE